MEIARLRTLAGSDICRRCWTSTPSTTQCTAVSDSNDSTLYRSQLLQTNKAGVGPMHS